MDTTKGRLDRLVTLLNEVDEVLRDLAVDGVRIPDEQRHTLNQLALDAHRLAQKMPTPCPFCGDTHENIGDPTVPLAVCPNAEAEAAG